MIYVWYYDMVAEGRNSETRRGDYSCVTVGKQADKS
jgi:hypothetical protein